MMRSWVTATKLSSGNAHQKHKVQTVSTGERLASGHPDEPSATAINSCSLSAGRGKKAK